MKPAAALDLILELRSRFWNCSIWIYNNRVSIFEFVAVLVGFGLRLRWFGVQGLIKFVLVTGVLLRQPLWLRFDFDSKG